MAVTTEDLLIQLQVDAKDTSNTLKDIKEQLKSLNKAQDETAKTSKKTSDSLSDFGTSMVKIRSAIDNAKTAFNLLAAPINRALDEATKAQTAFDKFAISMKFFGGAELSKSTKGLNDLADAMEAATGVDGDALLALAGRGAALGLTNTELEKLITGATDLAGLMGGDVSTAGEALLNSLNGQTKALAKYVPEVANLKQGQLEAGAAIGQTAEKLKGLGSAFGGTAQGIEARFTAKVGKAFEELGKTIQQSFNLIQGKKLSLNFLDDIIKAIEDTRPYIVGFFKTMADLDWASIGIAVGVIATSFTLISGALVAAIPAVAAFLVPFGLIALKATVISLAIGGVLAIIEIAIRNFTQLGTVASLAFIKIEQAVLKARIAFNEFTGDTEESDALNKRLEESKKRSEELGSSLKLDLGVTGKIINSVTDAVKNFSGNVEQAKTPVNGVADALGKMGDKGVSKIREINDAAKSAIDALKQMASVQSPRDEIAQINVKYAQDRLKIEQEYQKVVDAIGVERAEQEAESLRNQAIQNAYQDMQFQIAEKYKGALDEINGKNKELALAIKNNGALQQDVIQNNLKESLDAIDRDMEARIKALGALTPAMEEEFKKQADLQKKLADDAAKNAPSRAFEAPKKQGEDIGKAISGELSDGVYGSVMGAMSGIGSVVSAAQAVVDVVPNLLNGISNLIGSITELPMKILEGVTKIISGIAGFLTNFISNIGKMVTGILDAIIGLIIELPKLVVNFLTQIPKILLSIVSALPDMIEALVAGLIEAVPMLALGLIEFLVKDAPKIALQMVKVLAIQLPIAIVKGIVNAIKNIFSSLKNLLTGGSVFKDVGQSIAKGFGTGLKKLSGIGSKIFEVKDLAENALGPAADKANQLLEQINAAGEDAYGWITKAWIWVYDNIIKPIGQLLMFVWEGLKIVGLFVVSIFKGTWEALKAVAYFVRDIFTAVWNFGKAIFQVVIDAFMAVFNFIVTLFDDPIQAFKNLWQDVKNMFSGVIDAFANFFGGLWDAIKGYGARIWEGFQEAVGGVINMFTAMGRWIWEGIISVAGGIGSFFSTLGNNIWGGFTGGTEKIKKFFTELGEKIWEGLSDGLSSLGSGVGGAWDDFTDALGNISFNNQGGIVPGTALTSGDSIRNDIIPAWLSPGEAVIPRSLMANPQVNEVVQRILSRESIGNLSPSQPVQFMPGLGAQSVIAQAMQPGSVSNQYNIEVSMVIDNKDPMDENFLRNRLIPRMQEELKRASMEGKFVISQKGIRNV